MKWSVYFCESPENNSYHKNRILDLLSQNVV